MHRSKVNRRIIISVALGAVLVLAGAQGWLGPLRWLYDHTLVSWVRDATGLGSGTSAALSNLGQIQNLARDNTQLEQENANLRQRLAADAQTRRENDTLRQQLGLEVAGAPHETAAEVVAFQPDTYRQFVTLNKGSRDGLAKGMAAMSEGVVIGTISDVQASTAKLTLVTDPEFRIAAQDQDTGSATGVVRGQLGSGLVMEDIGQTDSIKPGDTITTSGLGGVIPAGLYIGQVQSVNAAANAVFQSASISTTLKPNRLHIVFVVAGP